MRSPRRLGAINSDIKDEDRKVNEAMELETSVMSNKNLTSALAKFVARAISLAPAKLSTDSVGGGLRYWAGVGGLTAGLIQQIGDAVIDLWDTSMRNPHATKGVGMALQDALNSFLILLASSAKKEGSPSHASSALRFLRDSGQSAVSLEKAADGLARFNKILGSPSTKKGSQIDHADSEALCHIVDVIANAAETLRPHGGVTHLLGEPGKEFAVRMASLAVHDVPASLKVSLLKAVSNLGDRRAISLFLESAACDNCAPLRRYMRGVESQAGDFQLTIQALKLALQTVAWGDDEFPETAIESIAAWFATEEVLTFWSRRKYTVEAHRWELVKTAAELISEVIRRNPTSDRSFRILARLLTPAPGTGAASFSLRSLLYATGLMRVGEEREDLFGEGHIEPINNDKRIAQLYRVTGRECLEHAAEHGLGDAYREMQNAAEVCARLISLILSAPPGRVAVPGMVVVPAPELLLGEVKAISSAASLVFPVSGLTPSIARAGYSPSVCAAIHEMLATAAQKSVQIAAILARDSPGSPGTAAQFRTSLASIISHASRDTFEPTFARDGAEEASSGLQLSPDVPIMHSALRIVEASLGVDGGSPPGMFLLGLQFDSSGFYASAEYGVLGALVELIAGVNDPSGRVDNKCRSTAATFLERLAANAVRRTSIAVIEHLKDVAGPNDPNVRGGGFADEMLFRIIGALGLENSVNYAGSSVDWAALGELLSAFMSLSALQVRLFPRYELERCIGNSSTLLTRLSSNAFQTGSKQALPSPIDLLRLLALISGSGAMNSAFDALRTWAHLLGTRISVHGRNTGYSSVPVLFEVVTMLLDALIGTDSGNDLSSPVRKDGGEMASSIVVLCIARMRDCDNPHDPRSEEYISDIQCTALLNNVLRAIAAINGSGANFARTRTSLYAALLTCGVLCQKRVSEDAIARAFGARHGPRQLNGTEAVISAACLDAVFNPNAAGKATAMAVVSMTTLMDPVRSVTALGTQNRLKKVTYSALSDPESCRLVAQACIDEKNDSGFALPENGKQRAALVVTEAALSLIHAVSAAGNGARIISDSGIIEAAGQLLASLGSRGLPEYDILGMQINNASNVEDRPRKWKLNAGRMNMDDTTDDESAGGNPNFAQNGSMMRIEDLGVKKEGDRRFFMVAAVTGAMAAALSCTNGTVVESTVKTLTEGGVILVELLRKFRSLNSDDLAAVGNLGLVVSRVPSELLGTKSHTRVLRTSLASIIGNIIPRSSSTYQVGASGSPLSVGINLKRPEDAKDARRLKVPHPEGGSLLERDLIYQRACCAQNVFAALRTPVEVLSLFSPYLNERGRADVNRETSGAQRTKSSERVRISEVVRVCRAALEEMQRSAEESMQVDTRIAGETGTSISSRRVVELSRFCQEEFSIEPGTLNGQTVLECLKKSSMTAREHADRCMTIVEGALFILREYMRCAKDILRGVGPKHSRAEYGTEADENAFTLEEAEVLLNESKRIVVPICKDIEALPGGIWGGKDS